jgi:hypothetical protein
MAPLKGLAHHRCRYQDLGNSVDLNVAHKHIRVRISAVMDNINRQGHRTRTVSVDVSDALDRVVNSISCQK